MLGSSNPGTGGLKAPFEVSNDNKTYKNVHENDQNCHEVSGWVPRPVVGLTTHPKSSLWGHLFNKDGLTDKQNENTPQNVPIHGPNDVRTIGKYDERIAQRSHSAWKPVDQPMWRKGNDCIWDKQLVSNQGGHIALPKQTDHSRVFTKPDHVCMAHNLPCEERPPLIARHPQSEVHIPQGMSVRPAVTDKWYESSQKDVEVYEDWYYAEREEVNVELPINLTNCSTTTGGIQVCRNAAQHWVYPSHIPERKYQLHAISRALFANTLVCYPTGLGKTLIAAVVMHNFVRWFPKSKVVFIAPTKPLVSQQMKACQNFMGLDVSSASEMTGRAKGDERMAAWNSDRILAYFCTPQTFWNDVKRGICPYEIISCVVVDECHRATGQADVVQAIKYMRNVKKSKFRVLGMSATPGSSQEQVQEVIDSLGINNVVFKDENDKDIAPYVHKKESEVYVVNPEGAENAARSMLMASLQRIIGDLSSHGQYYGVADAERVTRYGIQQARKCYKGGSWSVIQQFSQASILSDVRDQLDGYGPKTALAFLQTKMIEDKSLKALHSKDPQFACFITSLDKSVSQGGSNPKIQKLKEILQCYFDGHSDSKSCRAIIFATLRDGVASILDSLEEMRPKIKAKGFIGQGGGGRNGRSGMKQAEQKKVLSEFTSGECNLIVATCIGEEGLDIPNVDLIICFDAISSPTRALQRQGRTGRHGDGKVIYLLTAGQEEERFNKSSQAMSKLHSQLKEADRYFTLSSNAIRMLPREFNPKLAHIVPRGGTPANQNGGIESEYIPLARKLQDLRDQMERNSSGIPFKERDADCVGSMKESSIPSEDKSVHISRKRRQNFVLQSQSPIQRIERSPLSLEDLSLIERIGASPITQKESDKPNMIRICKAQEKQSHSENRHNTSMVKRQCRNEKRNYKEKFVDDEACLSGSDSGEDPDDLDGGYEDLDGFIDDGAAESDHSQPPSWHQMTKGIQSPSATQLMHVLRSRRKSVLISQPESLRLTPNEYDFDDSFINDQSIEYESSGDIVE